jgi:hemin uptake protein HemP
MPPSPQHQSAVQRPGELAEAQPQVVRSAQLLRGARELHIEHAGHLYRLRETAQGKLILTK